MTREGLFEFAAEKRWQEVLETARTTHSLPEIAAKLNKRENSLLVEFRAMCAMGLLQLLEKAGGGYMYVTTVLGVKFLQEENTKKGLTYSCQLCGITTGQPHICPVFFPEFK